MELWFEKYLLLIEKYPYLKTLILSIGLVFFFYCVQKLLVFNFFRKNSNKMELKILQKKVKQYLAFVLILSLLVLWFSQLQFLIVSILAVAAAIVVALKELIMCVTGGTLINIANTFKVGDRIDVDNIRGFVIEKNFLTTKVLEIGPEKNSQQTTGDIITIPNSIMLSKSLKNESYFRGYSIKSFVFKVNDLNVLEEFEQDLLSMAKKLCQDYLDEAKDNISRFCERENLDVPSIEPRTKIIIENGKDFSVLIKLPIANIEIATIEQKLNRYFLKWKLKKKHLSVKE